MGERPTHAADGAPLIDRNAHRCQLVVAAVINGGAAVSGWWLLPVLGACVYAVGCLDFPRTSPIVTIWDAIARRLLPPRVLVDARPAGVMAASTVGVMIVAAIGLTTSWAAAVQIVLGLFGIGLVIEAVVGRCVTCESYRWLATRGIVHPNPPLTDACSVVPVD